MGLLTEIAALAKAGYSVAEVKELISLGTEQQNRTAQENPPQANGQDPEAQKEPGKDQQAQPAQGQDPEPSSDPSPAQSEDQSEDLSSRIADLEKQLEAAQAINRKQDISKSKTETDQLEELARSFM